MSKLFERYKNLKLKDNKKIYIFLIGKFYTCLSDDAILLNKIFGYKIKDFYNQTTKVAFPTEALEKVTRILNINDIEYEILNKTKLEEKLSNTNNNILQEIKSINMNSITPIDAFNKLFEFQKQLKEGF